MRASCKLLLITTGVALTRASLLNDPNDIRRLSGSLPTELIDATRSPAAPHAQQAHEPLISDDVVAHILDTLSLWGARGLTLAVVRRVPGSDEFDVDTRAFGTKRRNGEPMRTDVRSPWMARDCARLTTIADSVPHRE